MLWVAIVTNVVALAAIPAWAMLSDRIGRKPVFIFGAVGSGALMFAYLGAIASGSYLLIFLAAILMSGVVYSAQNGIWPALYGEMFPTRVRLSGMAIGTQIGFAIGGFAPTVAAAIDGNGPRAGSRSRRDPALQPGRGPRRRHRARDLPRQPGADRRPHGVGPHAATAGACAGGAQPGHG